MTGAPDLETIKAMLLKAFEAGADADAVPYELRQKLNSMLLRPMFPIGSRRNIPTNYCAVPLPARKQNDIYSRKTIWQA